MPRVIGMREIVDRVIYDTHRIEPGQSIFFFGAAEVGDRHRTNMLCRGMLPGGQTATVCALGLRILGATRDEEDALLDHFTMGFALMDRMHGNYPGSVLSTLRNLSEVEVDLDNHPGLFLPGYVLQRPIVIPTRAAFYVEVCAATSLPGAVHVRAILCTRLTVDLQ